MLPRRQVAQPPCLGGTYASRYTSPMSTPTVDIKKLTADERLRLIEDLWESLRKTPDSVPLTPAQIAELDRRLDEMDNGETASTSWDELKSKLLDRLR